MIRALVLSCLVVCGVSRATLAQPALGPHIVSFNVTASVANRTLIVRGSNVATISGKTAGEVIFLRRYTGLYYPPVRFGLKTNQLPVKTDLVDVLAGVTKVGDDVSSANPFPGGVVITVPVSQIDHIEVDLYNGSDELRTNNLEDLTLDVDLGSGTDMCKCVSRAPLYVYGGYGNDDIECWSGPALVYGGPGNDTILGTAFDDELYGSSGNDTIDGGMGHDIIDGGRGNDDLHGSFGHDVLIGGYGADDLSGGQDVDILIGSILEVDSWPAPDEDGIRFTLEELGAMLMSSHLNDHAADVLKGNWDNDFIVWWRFQDWIDFKDPDGFDLTVIHPFGTVAIDDDES